MTVVAPIVWSCGIVCSMKITVNNWLKHWIEDLYPSRLRILGHGGYACNNHHTRNWFDFTCLLLSLGDLALFIYVEISQALKGCHTFPWHWDVTFRVIGWSKAGSSKCSTKSIIHLPPSCSDKMQNKLLQIECTRLKSHALVRKRWRILWICRHSCWWRCWDWLAWPDS